jgi:hypothetical protein
MNGSSILGLVKHGNLRPLQVSAAVAETWV